MFVVHCKDKPGAAHIRAETRPAHVEYLKSNLDRIIVAGPVQTEDREGMIGSVLILDFPNRDELDAFLAADPYAKAGLFESVTVLPWKKALP
jgi:uncharacterized protein